MKKPRPIHRIGRKRRTLGWTLITLGVLVAAIWAASGWWWGQYKRGRWSVTLMHGTMGLYHWAPDHNLFTGLTIERVWPEFQKVGGFGWWYGFGYSDLSSGGTEFSFGVGFFQRSPSGERSVWLLLWPFPLLLWGAGVPLLRSGILARRQAMTGKCKSCGYDLAGLAPDSICPECGNGPNAGAAAT